MKNIILVVIALVLSLGTYAQEQEYDTIVYFPQTIFECPMLFDPVATEEYYNNLDEYNAHIAAGGNPGAGWFSANYHSFYRFWDMFFCNVDEFVNLGTEKISSVSLCNIVACNYMASNPIDKIRSYAQPYYLPDLDTAARVIGVAAKIFGQRPASAATPYFFLYDNNGNLLDYVGILKMSPNVSSTDKPYGKNPFPTTLDYYMFNNQHQIQAFSLAFDKNHTYYDRDFSGNVPYQFDHTMTFKGGDKEVPWYHECRYEDLGCYEYLPPLYLMYDSTNWVSFDQDEFYQFYQKKQIGFYPIIIIPKMGVGLSSEELAKHCNLVPNPATIYSKVISRYKIERLEIYDMQGKKIEEIAVNNYEYYIDLQHYPKGKYVVNIITQKGNASKKLIVQ